MNASDLLELELQVVLSHLIWVLGNKKVLEYLIPEVLRQLFMAQIGHYNSEDQDVP